MTAGRLFTLLLLFVGLWLLWSGHYEPLPLVFGAVACVLTLWLAARMQAVDEEGYPLTKAGSVLLYVPWITWQILKSNVDVAGRILHPKLPIDPAVGLVRASQRTTIGQVIHANSITITPGTVSLDVRDGQILVHALSRAALAEDQSGEMDRRVAKLEGGH